jgi:hypothetical protein
MAETITIDLNLEVLAQTLTGGAENFIRATLLRAFMHE